MTILILTPTHRERHGLASVLSPAVHEANGMLELCGFGLVAAAARAMQLVETYQPTRVILVGIAGSLGPKLEIGTARSFRQVTCVGIGAGSGPNHKSASEIGWKHWVPTRSEGEEMQAEIADVLPLAPSLTDSTDLGGELLSVCAASADELEVAMRLERHPRAVAEDMEGFGVAVACFLSGVPLEIIRGISNRAGDREQTNWNIDGALHAAGLLTLKSLSA